MEEEAKFIQETTSPPTTNNQANKHVIDSKTKLGTKRSKINTKEIVRGKCRLEDILQAIDITENHVVKAAEIEGSRVKRKGLIAKKLDFSPEDSGFLLKPRKPFTRSQFSTTVTIKNK